MVEATLTEQRPSPDEAPRIAPSVARDLDARLGLVVVWHVAAAASSVVMMLLASRTGDEELPATIGVFLRLFGIASAVAHAAAAFGVSQRRRWGRTVSLVVSYLTFVV